MKTSFNPPVQASMFDVFEQAEQEAITAHLPGNMPDAISYYRQLLQRHHDALFAGDAAQALRLNDEAHDLAAKLNGADTCGIIAGPDAPGCVLERETAATPERSRFTASSPISSLNSTVCASASKWTGCSGLRAP